MQGISTLIRTPDEVNARLAVISTDVFELIRHGPVLVTVAQAIGKRSLDQNALAFRWYGEIHRQGREYTTDQARNFCKYHFGGPIRAAAEPEFAAFLALLESRYAYEELIAAMTYVEVTRHFDAAQMSEYLTAMQAHFRTRGVLLTGWDQGLDQYPEQRRRATLAWAAGEGIPLPDPRGEG